MTPVPSCPHCDHGWVRIERPDTRPHVKPGTTRSSVARCLCDKGARLGGGARLDEVLSEDEINAMWPDGRPSTDSAMRDRLVAAGVPPACAHWTLQTYRDHLKGPDARIARATTWLSLPTEKRSDLVLFGGNGTGKTGMAISLIHDAVTKRQHVAYLDTRMFFARWSRCFDSDPELDEQDLLDIYATLDLLVLDEFSAHPSTERQTDFFRVVLDTRQKRLRPTVLLCNIAHDVAPDQIPSTLSAIFGPVVYDRLRERAQFWAFAGPSQRPAYKEPR